MRISDWSSDVCSSDLKFAEAHLDEHVRDAAGGGFMDDHACGLPIAIDDIDGLEVQCLGVERDTLGALGIEHRLALLQPELAVLGPLGRRKILEHVFIIDDTVLENLEDRKSTRLNSSH